MDHFPIFVAVQGRRVVLSGGGAAALAKLRLLLKTTAHITVFAPQADPQIQLWAAAGRLRHVSRQIAPGDALCAVLAYAADEDATLDARTAHIARADGAMVNIVDNLADSQFITPGIVDRDPVTVAIGTEGAAPVLARAIKADLETRLPTALGPLARLGKEFRKVADSLPMGRARRDFWRDYYYRTGPAAFRRGESAVRHALDATLSDHMRRKSRAAHVHFVGAGPGDPDLLTLKARTLLDEADVVIHDSSVSAAILDLARREAVMIDADQGRFPRARRAASTLLAEHAQSGAQVVRLISGDPGAHACFDTERQACDRNAIAYSVIPGVASPVAPLPVAALTHLRDLPLKELANA